MHSFKILLPILPSSSKKNYFKGFINICEQSVTIYVTNFSTNDPIENLERKDTDHEGVMHGFCMCCQNRKIDKNLHNYFVLDQHTNPQVVCLFINGRKVDETDNCVIILYDLNEIKSSETVSSHTDIFLKLHSLLQNEITRKQEKHLDESIILKPHWLLSSMLIQHLLNHVLLINWLWKSMKVDRKVMIRQGNLIIAIFIDIILGYIILQIVIQDKKELGVIFTKTLEKLVNSLYSLLKWLMGAPAGLKLNNAFNKMLGKYFSYHIQLWWLFLDVSSEKLDIILNFYHCLGYLGFTFQAAIVSDMICIVTFHSYCIYVYAARLFNIQISGLIALLRLFVGRKFNPLRGSIDSCEYTNQELFVGTVAFTILLLLLPTTTMYYIVFTLFRLLSLMTQSTLAKLIYFIKTLPAYVTTLWLIKSPKVAGNIMMETVNEDAPQLILRVKLICKPVHDLVNNYQPPVEAPKQAEWTCLLSNVLTGNQII